MPSPQPNTRPVARIPPSAFFWGLGLGFVGWCIVWGLFTLLGAL
jgi:hypothetical protein